MPRYDYRCTHCETEFELVQKFSEAGKGECPSCGGAGQRVFHAVPVIYKGSGFYTTDYGRPKRPADGQGSRFRGIVQRQQRGRRFLFQRQQQHGKERIIVRIGIGSPGGSQRRRFGVAGSGLDHTLPIKAAPFGCGFFFAVSVQ